MAKNMNNFEKNEGKMIKLHKRIERLERILDVDEE